MIQRLLTEYKIAEAKKQIQAGTAHKAVVATILEAGSRAFYQGYYGDNWSALESEIRKANRAQENAYSVREALLTDISRMRRALREAHTTTDFPIVLGEMRQRVMRESLQPVQDTPLMAAFPQRVTTNFRPVKGMRLSTLNRLSLRAEGTDVDKATFDYTEDGYAVANYELGVDFTWEMWKNDDYSIFQNALNQLGVAARRTRGLIVLEAILAGVPQWTPTAGAGGPTIANLEELITSEFGEEENDEGQPIGVSLTDIAFPTKWKTTAAVALKSANVIGSTAARNGQVNPVFECANPHEDRMMREVLGSDWLAYDNQIQWGEFLVLDDFQAGPLTYTKMPDVIEHAEQGSFDNHSISVKIGDAHGAKVLLDKGVRRVKGV